jgi:hypothetical protein
MSEKNPTARPARTDPHRLVTGAKVATVVASAVAFGAVAGLVIGGTTSAAASSPAAAGSPGPNAPDLSRAAPTPAQDFFAVPPGFAQPPLVDGGQGFGASGGQAAAGQGGFGGQVPNLRSSGS